MFAIVKSGGKQYKVAKDDELVVEKINVSPGAFVDFDEVLMIGEDGKKPVIGVPLIEKAKVFAEVVQQSKAKKVLVFKKKRRQNYRKTKGHRQEQTLVKIVEISPSGNRTGKSNVEGEVKKKKVPEVKKKKKQSYCNG